MASRFCLNLHWHAHLQSLRNTEERVQVCLLLSAYVDKLSITFCISFIVFSKLRGWFVLLKCFLREEQRNYTNFVFGLKVSGKLE